MAEKEFEQIVPGLFVYAPFQDEWGEIKVKEMDPQTTKDKPEKFILVKKLANIAVFRMADFIEEEFDDPIKIFNPPIELRVEADEEVLSDREVNHDFCKLKLAYWNANDEDWVNLKDKNDCHEYNRIDGTNVVEVKIKCWIGDPTLAWGR